MGLLAAVLLRALHFIYALVVLVCSFWNRFTLSHPLATRRRVPKHLALLLVADRHVPSQALDDCLLQSVINAVACCRAAGVDKLTVYEEHGAVLKNSQRIRELLIGEQPDEDSSESDIEYPLTPPPSDYSDSRPISPQHDFQTDMNTVSIHIVQHPRSRKTRNRKGVQRRRQEPSPKLVSLPSLTLCLASRSSAKPAIASVAQSLASRLNSRKGSNNKSRTLSLTVDMLDAALENDHHLSSPDFMILHPINPLDYNQTPLELHGYPPWHIRLTEIYHNRDQHRWTMSSWLGKSNKPPPLVPLDETIFNQALDEFATAEMRFGK
ncbi:hypothetical protein Hypma_015567 [Hypsizygus marmoreus]|uniref:ditrans,polycis-polyprenyl diphosphate synthase [(2E,6E)-farnesyldiphosphate specific] n=1 Tax=Hypsizygus marmoreus TaxID=39966 RepID=A0A369K4F6_HYPMA|nr:hypothetical protein Hypma_015567 [Hypsizygus marmoreus]